MSQTPNSMNTNIPNAARVYDYSLGGHHNFEADRQAAEYMFTLVPSTRKWVRLLRMFLHEAAQQLGEEGFTQFLDLASGLPTVEHIHSSVPSAKVIYVDVDPVVVNYGREILGNNPNVRYIQSDIRDIDRILNAPEVKELFGNNRKVAFGFNGITPFLSDDEIRKIMKATYEWAAPGSKMFLTHETKNPNKTTPKWEQFVGMFTQMGENFHLIGADHAKSLLAPWKLDANGFRPISDCLGLKGHITTEDRESIDLEFYGVFTEK